MQHRSPKPKSLAVARVEDREALKRCGWVTNPDNHAPPLVHLKSLAHLKGLTREEIPESRLVNDGRIRLTEVIDRTHQHLPRSTHKRRIVHTQENHVAEFSVRGFRASQPLVERHRPL